MTGYIVLYIEFDDCIKNDSHLIKKYEERITEHNKNINSNLYPDSGFDLLTPKLKNYSFSENETRLIPFGIKCCAYKFLNDLNTNKLPIYKYIASTLKIGNKTKKKYIDSICVQPFCVYPRSSIWKSHFRLANNVGIIDSGYRGTLYGPMHNVKSVENSMVYEHRYLQITMPDLTPFYVCVVDEIKLDSKRGVGGIGSTGN